MTFSEPSVSRTVSTSSARVAPVTRHAAEQKEQAVTKELAVAKTEILELKRVLGFGGSDTMQVIGQEVLKDMQVTASSLPEADRERVEALVARRKEIEQLAAQNPTFTGELLRAELVNAS